MPDAELPVLLPELEDFKPSGSPEGPLATAGAWLETVDQTTGKRARRETNTMPQWAGSCWYYLRFIDPTNDERLVDPKLEQYWLPVDLYVGGSEHAVLHLLYARFWHKVLYDAGVVSTPGAVLKLVHQGMIFGELEFTRMDGGSACPPTVSTTSRQQGDRVRAAANDDACATCTGRGARLQDEQEPRQRRESRRHRRALRRRRVPALRDVHGPARASEAVEHARRRRHAPVLEPRVAARRRQRRGRRRQRAGGRPTWRRRASSSALLHQTIAKVTEDIEAMRFNTAISALMELTNAAYKWPQRAARGGRDVRAAARAARAASRRGALAAARRTDESLAYHAWPVADAALLKADVLEIPVQVNGKVRGKISVPAEAQRERGHRDRASADQNVGKHLAGQSVKRAIYVRGRIVNFVVGGS